MIEPRMVKDFLESEEGTELKQLSHEALKLRADPHTKRVDLDGTAAFILRQRYQANCRYVIVKDCGNATTTTHNQSKATYTLHHEMTHGNTHIHTRTHTGWPHVIVVATREICKGDPILCETYGEHYWEIRDNEATLVGSSPLHAPFGKCFLHATQRACTNQHRGDGSKRSIGPSSPLPKPTGRGSSLWGLK